jgi:hypothetical protein
MHQDVALNLPHAPQGELRLDGAARVLHVSTDLKSDQDRELWALATALRPRLDPHDGFDQIIIYFKDGSIAHRS